MKQLVSNYSFNAAAQTVTFTEYDQISLNRVSLVINSTRNEVIYNLIDADKGGTASGNVLTLEYDTTGMSNSDALAIYYFPQENDPQRDRTIVGNARTKFRDSFGNGVDPAAWDISFITAGAGGGAGHIVNRGGNAIGSSYLRISMSPLLDDTEITLTSKAVFRFPLRAGFGVSMSQRIVGQEVFVGLCGINGETGSVAYSPVVADVALANPIVIASNVATITQPGHGFNGGDRIAIYGCVTRALNVAPVVVTPVDANTFTVPLTLANGTYPVTGGFIHFAEPFRSASNGMGYLFESATATNASTVMRRGGDKFRTSSQTVVTTVASQPNTAPYTDSFNAAGGQEVVGTLEEVQFRSLLADNLGTPGGLVKFSQGSPDPDVSYRVVVRVRLLPGQTTPVARITAISKAGTTTATVTTDVPHGLAVGDPVQIYGARDQTAFTNSGSTAVVTVPTSTTFTVAFGTATTATSQDGTVIRNQGGTGTTAYGQAVQSLSRTGNVLTLIGSATWATPLPGEYVQVHGLVPSLASLEGGYKVLRVSLTTLELDAPGANVASTPTGGAVIKRTDVRLHFARVLDYTRHVTEITGGRGNTTDVNNAVPVAITGSAAVPAAQSTGASSVIWNAAGWGGFLVQDVASSALTATATTALVTPGVVTNIGTYAHSFAVVVGAVTGTNPTLDVQVQESADNGVNWVPIYDFQRITAAGAYYSPLIRAQWGTRYRYVQTVAGTTPSFTRAIYRIQFSSNAPLVREFVDRSVVLTTLNSTTPVYNVDGCSTIQLTANIGAVTTTAPALQLEGSEDGTNFYALGAPLTAVASSTVFAMSPAAVPKFIRARVSTAGVGVTAGYVGLKAFGL